MFNTVMKPIRAAALGLTLAITGAISAPSQAAADEYDTARIVGGLVALGIIAHALSDDDDKQVARQHRPYDRHVYRGGVYDQPRIHRQHRPQAQHRPHAWPRHADRRPRYIDRDQPHVGRRADHLPRYHRDHRRAQGNRGWNHNGYGHGYEVRRQTGHPSVISPNH